VEVQWGNLKFRFLNFQPLNQNQARSPWSLALIQMLPLTKMCLTNPSTSYQKMASGHVLWTHQTRDLLSVLGSETNPTSPLHISWSSSETCKPPHTKDKGMSGEEISQRDHGHNLKDLEPIRAWTRPLSALPHARHCARHQSAHWRLPAHVSSACQTLPSATLAHAYKASPGVPHLIPCSPSLKNNTHCQYFMKKAI
jgi:hypothetical protein